LDDVAKDGQSGSSFDVADLFDRVGEPRIRGNVGRCCTLLWMLRRRGLFLVSWTLVAEIAYFFILDTGMTMYVHHKMGGGEFFENFSYITLGGNVVLAVQLVTGFPVIAAVLIFFAYRYLGIPARPLPENVGERT
jgi:hypothetical protein